LRNKAAKEKSLGGAQGCFILKAPLAYTFPTKKGLRRTRKPFELSLVETKRNGLSSKSDHNQL
jgi:hypothetical protein